MAQGMDDKIRQISEMLNSQEGQEGIRQLFSSFRAPRQIPSGESLQEIEGDDSGPLFSRAPVPYSSQETDWIGNIQSMLGQMNNIQDSRVNLLRSVHPFLNPARRERCATCMNILKIAGMVKTFTSNGGRLF